MIETAASLEPPFLPPTEAAAPGLLARWWRRLFATATSSIRDDLEVALEHAGGRESDITAEEGTMLKNILGLRERRIEDGWTVTITTGARSDSSGFPRSLVTFTWRPTSACAGTAPRHTSTRGLTTASSASSHGRQAAISPADGFLCLRRLPCGSHLKCFTALVM